MVDALACVVADIPLDVAAYERWADFKGQQAGQECAARKDGHPPRRVARTTTAFAGGTLAPLSRAIVEGVLVHAPLSPRAECDLLPFGVQIRPCGAPMLECGTVLSSPTALNSCMLGAKERPKMAFTVIWYGRQGIVDKETFDAEKTAKDHAISMFQTRKGDDGIVAVEVRNDNGAVVFSHAES